MFPTRYFGNRYFATRYFPKVGSDTVARGLTSITRRVRLTDIDTRVLYIVDHVHKVRV